MLVGLESGNAILARAARGDSSAFARIVEDHQAMVYSLARHCLQDEATAEEVAQEVFLELHRRIGEIESPVHLTRWLRRVAMNRCVDQSRRRRYRPRVGLESAPEPAAPAAHDDPMLRARMERLVAELSPRARAIVILRFQEDLDPPQIAETLGIPVGTVKSNLHRSLAVLRARMERARAGKESVR